MTFFENSFDLVISLGEDCGCASYLNTHSLRCASYPFDWLIKASFETRINLISNDFSGFLKKENLQPLIKVSDLSDPHHDYYEDKKTGFYFYHDFPAGIPLKNTFPEVKEKYKRRIKRLYQTINIAERILFVWLSRDKKISNNSILAAYDQLSQKFPQKQLFLLVLENGENNTEILSDYILKLTYDNASFSDPALEWQGNKEKNDDVFSQIKLSGKKIISEADLLTNIHQNKRQLDFLIREADFAHNDNEKIDLLRQAAIFATYHVCGELTSPEIENSLCKIAQKYSIPLSKTYEPNSVLHVASKIYIMGGHSTVLDRWVNNSPGNIKNSLALTWYLPREHVLKTTQKAVKESGGDIFYLSENNESPLFIALKLREIASHYEKIVLHIHMEDVIPILAFGTPEFKRPIALFNHSDHIFWLGSSIADQVISFRKYTRDLCFSERQIENNALIPLPLDEPQTIINEKERNELLQKLNIPTTGKIVFTMARPHKFLPFNQYDFLSVIEKIAQQEPAAYFVVIGVSDKDFPWNTLSLELQRKTRLIGIIPIEETKKYIMLADVALDSLPFSSTTSFYEAAKQNIPAFTLLTPMNHDDLNDETDTSCISQEQLIAKVITALQKTDKTETKAFQFFKENNFPKAFREKLLHIYQNFPSVHSVRNLSDNAFRTITPIELFTELNFLVEKSCSSSKFSRQKMSWKNKLRYKIWKHLNKKLKKKNIIS